MKRFSEGERRRRRKPVEREDFDATLFCGRRVERESERCGTIETPLFDGTRALFAANAPVAGTVLSRSSHRRKEKEEEASAKARRAREDGGRKQQEAAAAAAAKKKEKGRSFRPAPRAAVSRACFRSPALEKERRRIPSVGGRVESSSPYLESDGERVDGTRIEQKKLV